jgi:hypothetical protein
MTQVLSEQEKAALAAQAAGLVEQVLRKHHLSFTDITEQDKDIYLELFNTGAIWALSQMEAKVKK